MEHYKTIDHEYKHFSQANKYHPGKPAETNRKNSTYKKNIPTNINFSDPNLTQQQQDDIFQQVLLIGPNVI